MVEMTFYILAAVLISSGFATYLPTWDSLESRPLPSWYDDQKFGIFCHWGVYSVPAHRSEWLWWYWKGEKDREVNEFIANNYPPGVTYADFAKDFKADLFNPEEFANVVKSSGAKYFVFTSKHHEGFTMWPSVTSFNWNSVDIGPKRDIVGDLKKYMTKSGITFGLYFSQYDWFHPLYLMDKANENLTAFSDSVSYPQMLELVSLYKPSVIWSDGDWEKPEEYWKSKEFLAWLYNESPVKDTVVVNDRWGKGVMGKHGGFLTFSDHYDPGVLQPRKWENCFTMDKKSWGYRRDMEEEDVQTVYEILFQISRTVACGGNILLNVGPDDHGRIPLIFQTRLHELGLFLDTVGEALYDTKPWIYQNDTSNTWYTSRYHGIPDDNSLYNKQFEQTTIIYAWILDTSGTSIYLNHIKPTKQTIVKFLGTSKTFKLTKSDEFKIPAEEIPWRDLPRRDVIVLRIEHAASDHHIPTIASIKDHRKQRNRYHHHHHHHHNRHQFDKKKGQLSI